METLRLTFHGTPHGTACRATSDRPASGRCATLSDDPALLSLAAVGKWFLSNAGRLGVAVRYADREPTPAVAGHTCNPDFRPLAADAVTDLGDDDDTAA